MLAGAADAASDWLDRLVGCLMGFCAALGVGILGVGFVSLANLWKELVLQLKNAKISSLLLSIPLAVIGLALGLGVFMALGMFLTKLSDSWTFLTRPLLWGMIAVMFYSLWKGRTHAALMLRLILMVSFSVTIITAAAFAFWWIYKPLAKFVGLIIYRETY